MPVYYEFRKAGDELLVTYWFSYGHSAPHTGGAVGAALGDKLSHEGDWENVDVALALDGSAPRAVYFYGHGAPTRRREQLELNGDHGRLQRARLTRLLLEGGTAKVCGDLGLERHSRTRASAGIPGRRRLAAPGQGRGRGSAAAVRGGAAKAAQGRVRSGRRVEAPADRANRAAREVH